MYLQHCFVVTWLVPHETAAVSAHVLWTPYNHAPCHFMQSYIRKVYACLAVTCHLHFCQNDRDLLRATAVKRGWNGYQKLESSQKVDPGEENFPPHLQGFEPATFQSQVRCYNHWAIPAPATSVVLYLAKGITPKMCWFCLVLISSVLLNPLCVWIVFQICIREWQSRIAENSVCCNHRWIKRTFFNLSSIYPKAKRIKLRPYF